MRTKNTKDFSGTKRWKSEARRRNKNHVHPTTGQFKWIWKSKKAKELGGEPKTDGWQACLDKAEEVWLEEVQPLIEAQTLLNGETIKKTNVVSILRNEGKYKPMVRRKVVETEGEAVPQGWVYVIQNPDVPYVLKVGKTFENGMPQIMSAARRFGRARLLLKAWFSDALSAEQAIHEYLSERNLRNHGVEDCGKELFLISKEEVVTAMFDYIDSIDGYADWDEEKQELTVYENSVR